MRAENLSRNVWILLYVAEKYHIILAKEHNIVTIQSNMVLAVCLVVPDGSMKIAKNNV